MADFLKRLLVVVLALRVVAAPVGLRPAGGHSSPHQSFTVRARHWLPQRLERSSSGQLQFCAGRNSITSAGWRSLLTHLPMPSASSLRLARLVTGVCAAAQQDRLAVCLRC